MTTEELEILVKQGEGYTLEFKENLGKKFAVEVVAFANSMGGKILKVQMMTEISLEQIPPIIKEQIYKIK